MHILVRCYHLLVIAILLHSNSGIGDMSVTLPDSSTYPWENSYNELFFIQQVDQNNITKLITQLGNWGVGRLLWHVKEMNHLGDRIRHVHPLCFLSYIYSQPELIRCMRLINANYFKRKEFIAGFSEKMETEAKRNNLIPYVRAFSQRIGCDRWEDIFIFLDRHDWVGLLAYLDALQLEKAR